MSYIISFVSQKGGVGKSTLARASAVALTQAGYRVRLCDLDTQQGTSIEWYRLRLNNGNPPLASVEMYGTIAQAIRSGLDITPNFDILIIDAPGRASEATAELARSSHIIIQPATGTLDDMRPGVMLFHELTKLKIPRKRMFFALNRITTDHEEATAREYITMAGYAALNTSLLDKVGYKSAQNEGLSITETQWPTLNTRATGLVSEIVDKLDQLNTSE